MLKIRHFVPTDEEYAAIVAIANAVWPEDPDLPENWRKNDEQWPKAHLFQRFVGEMDGRIVLEGAYMEPFWSQKPGKFQYGSSVHPDYKAYEEDGRSIYNIIYQYVLNELDDHDPLILWSGTREDQAEVLHFFEEKDFQFRMRSPISELDVPSFDFSKFDGVSEKVAARGIEIHTLAELQKRDPDWKEKIYELCWVIEQDVPQPDPPTKEPLEEWEKCFKNPGFIADGWFLAVDQGEYVGVSMLGISQARPEKMYVWLTGVVRSHRRMGIATALKLCTIELTQSRGATLMETGNEENNPMYDINMAMGFKPKPAWRDFEKILKNGQ